jgi:hypothetical protein
LSPKQKWVYPRLFRAARRLIEINAERYDPTLEEAAGHLYKAEIELKVDVQYTPTRESPPKASPKEQTMNEYIDQLFAECCAPRPRLKKKQLDVYTTGIKGTQTCTWLSIGKTSCCGRVSVFAHCKVHRAQLPRGALLPNACRKYGVGTQSET